MLHRLKLALTELQVFYAHLSLFWVGGIITAGALLYRFPYLHDAEILLFSTALSCAVTIAVYELGKRRVDTQRSSTLMSREPVVKAKSARTVNDLFGG